MKKIFKNLILCLMLASMLIGLVGCASNSKPQKVVIYTNADKEAVQAMQNSLNTAGYEGKYVLQSMGTSELGGKLMAEGDKIEANLVTMSSYFVESAQQKHKMFAELNFETKALEKYPAYYTPILANTGAIFINTQVIKDKGLAIPKSIKDLTKDEYKGLVSIPNIMNSSTAWLLMQAIISEYGEVEGKMVLNKLIQNCGPHIETSGSGPIKKVRVGEVAAGFGLRHQAVADKVAGKPMDYIDPIEGNYTLTESIAVVKKADTATTQLAMEMAKIIIEKARPELIKDYPVALYQGEVVTDVNKAGNLKNFEKPLTVELLEAHQEFFKAAK
ncbi:MULTISPECIES: extracellular solute-binding protein [Pelosinus]|uniref:ABC transporter, periplasmic binding protein n=1 Tax=Pelosinus fermentans B4 TaxID=1149862 RepID=I9LEX7_9FIRM|nr:MULTISPECIES: extracellular solute-binding protein [Pelosinus]EIW18901.1 ABC transporter, periplasmic binding protein [Pelosinus fermentans B4]EIW21888.1 ABC transporter, periplasmic binding protein [Pelosinus fermentans A11]OAM95261.1 ABC transporter periplasmic-binding protein [Pelosinus fermentans DSM 17108]SDR25534.1 iron(III) transport system substrate-binding protein [Pelosinus fermentans]